MPVIEIKALPQRDGLRPEVVLGAVSRAVAELLEEKPSGTWALWEEVPPGRYSEGGDAPPVQPPSTHPPLVRVTGFEGRQPAVVAAILTTVAETLAAELGLQPGNVFVRYEEQRAGRLYTGGEVR